MPPLSPLLPTSTPTQDTFTHTADTLLPSLTTLRNPPHRVIILAPSRPLIDASITSYPAYLHARTTSAHSRSLPLIYTSYAITLPLDYPISSSGTHISPSRPMLSSSCRSMARLMLSPSDSPFLVDDDDDNASPPTPLPTTPTSTRLLSAPTMPSEPFQFPMLPLSPLPPTPTRTRDTLTHNAETLLPNLTTLQGPPRLAVLLAPSRPLIDASIIISMPIYARVRSTTTFESLPPSVRRLRFSFKSVGKRTEEKILRSSIVVCPNIEELEIEGEGGEECWCSIVPHFMSLRALVMLIPGTAQVKTAKEELDEGFPLPKRDRTRSTLSTTSHSIVVSERARSSSRQRVLRPPTRRLPKRRTVAPSISPSPPLPILSMSPIR